MRPIVKKLVRKGKLSYLWVTRILAAPNHYKVSPAMKLRMNVQGGFIADQYVLYGLDTHRREDYLSEFDWYRSRWINEPFDPMLNNKVTCTEVLKHVAYVPEILMIKNKQRIWDPANPARLSTAAKALDRSREVGSVFMKPIGMGKGRGVHRIDCITGDGDTAYFVDASPATEEDVLDLFAVEDGWFLSPSIKQHPDLDAIFPNATNTARIITMRNPDTGEVEVFFAVLRLGTSSTVPVDNGSRGGLVAKVDLETGELSAARSLWSTEVCATHPDTGAQIQGATVPDWQKARDEVVRLALLFPYLQFVAWDVLVTSNGPCIIEANTSSGVNILQLWGPQRNEKLGAFYRAHGVIK